MESEAVVELDGLLNLPSDDSKEFGLAPSLGRVQGLWRAGDRGIRLSGGVGVEHGYGHENGSEHESYFFLRYGVFLNSDVAASNV